MLRAAPKNLGGRPLEITGSSSEPVSAPTLADLGIDKKTSMRAQPCNIGSLGAVGDFPASVLGEHYGKNDA